jgi:hypothetical protein
MTDSSSESGFLAFRKIAYERFERLMPMTDLTLIILKGHLLAEEQMDEFIKGSLDDVGWKVFSSLKLSFARRLDVARNLHQPKEPFAAFWAQVEALNKLRNHIAHNAEVPDLQERCTVFVQNLKPERIDLGSDLESQLVMTIGNIVASVSGLNFGRQLCMKRVGLGELREG